MGLTAVGDLIKSEFPEVMVLSVKLAEVVSLGPIYQSQLFEHARTLSRRTTKLIDGTVRGCTH